ncbi:stemmadenine O-acetyltransferase [Ricinus communis]|uniref:Anthranilate N-benzoyltransferase protein, putative n=1 Tax=Ricinus communis TaxID=3988 RepID=B9RAL6_RICCO|nr:stemmadenine O-acetyltransferase [Ricinus communis]EEF51843.1 Anthranilate N-benzoyltransferase protein, putative [Ricinus communis]|eukprot:XP_002511241.1 vinorine synthase [Ricinus communis]
MEVEIISKETVKPCSSTPEHQRTYKLSLLDQLAPPVYIPIVLFYSTTGENSSQKLSDHLKTSFSGVLTHFYPLAGRMKDGFSIDCNDEGAPYVEANVAGDMSIVLQEPEIHQLQKLLPCNPYDISSDISSQVILAAQVNHFDCGGMAISICIWHAIADASAAASFITSWAAMACGASDFQGVNVDCTSLFPPQDMRSFSLRNFVKEELSSNILVKRFLFDSLKLAALKEKVGSGPCLDCPTRVEAVAALIWGAVMAASTEEEEDESTREINVATISVGLRKRLIPPLPQLSIGNIYQVALANCSKNENMLDYNGLAGKLHESIGKMDNNFVRKIHAGGGYFHFLKKKAEELGRRPNLTRVFGFSSWCRFPFYEADFGWGKPTWVGTAMKLYKVAIFIDSKDGQGIEAWVSLPKEDMAKFEQNPDICAYASFKPST